MLDSSQILVSIATVIFSFSPILGLIIWFIRVLQTDVNNLRTQIESLKNESGNKDLTIKTLQDSVDGMKIEISNLKQQLKDMTSLLETSNKERDKLQTEVDRK